MSSLIKRREFIFLTAITIYFSDLLLRLTVLNLNSEFVSVLKYVRYFCYFLVVIKILMDSYDEKSIIKIIIVVVVVAISVFNAGDRTYLFYLLMFFAAKDTNFRKIIKCSCIVQGAVLIVFVFCSQMGWITNYLFVQSGGRNRFALGFSYSSQAPILFMFFIMSYIYLRKERMRFYEFIILEGINVWFYTMTDTKACFYLSSLLLAFVFVMRFYWNKKENCIRRNNWLIAVPSGCCVVALLLHICYNSANSTWASLNSLLNGRLGLGYEAIQTYGFTLFGQKINWVGQSIGLATGEITDKYNYVDCGYLHILLSYGLIFLILVILIYTYLMFMAIRIKDFYLQTILFAILVYCIVQPTIFNLAYNPFLLFIAAAWGSKSLESLSAKEHILIRKWIV